VWTIALLLNERFITRRMRKRPQALRASDSHRGEIALMDWESWYPDWCGRTRGLEHRFIFDRAQNLE
jgi:hypothetical protein